MEEEEPLDGTADIVRLIREVDDLDAPPSGRLDQGAFTFYAICWPTQRDGFIGFVKKSDPRRALKAGRRYFQYGDTLWKAKPPDLILEPDIDIVVTEEFIATVNSIAYKNLLNDVRVVLTDVPKDVKRIQARLKEVVPLSPASASALEEAAGRRVSLARRLSELPARLNVVELDEQRLRVEMRRVHVPSSLLLKDGEFIIGLEDVDVFLDVMEGRYFEDNLGGEHRRADRYSQRR